MRQPEVGDIAVCKHGQVGLVTEIDYVPDRKGVNRKMWKGIHLGRDDIGKPWQSRAPKRLLTVGDYLP